jgi:Reverse transcriptase (RNA-dependent DNA polymerase)
MFRVWEFWKLLLSHFGLVDACRQWMLALQSFFSQIGLQMVTPLLPQVFVLRNKNAVPELVVAVVVDDILISAVSTDLLNWFKDQVQRKFTIGSFSTTPFIYCGILVEDDGHSISLSMKDYQFDDIPLSRDWRKQWDSPCTVAKKKAVLSVAGRLNYLGCALSPVACRIASSTLQALPRFTVSDLSGFNAQLRAVRRVEARIRFPRIRQCPKEMQIYSFTDASQKLR